MRDTSSARSPAPFVPVGHISIDTVASTATPSLLLADPSTHRFHISAFYVSRAIHGGGIGGVVVREAEGMAVRVLGARVLTLDTLDKRVLLREEDGGFQGGRDLYRRFMGVEPPEVSFLLLFSRLGSGREVLWFGEDGEKEELKVGSWTRKRGRRRNKMVKRLMK